MPPADKHMNELLRDMYDLVRDHARKSVTTSKVHLLGSNRVCRFAECNLGNLISDSIFNFYADQDTGDSEIWSNVNAVVKNSGAFRQSLSDGETSHWNIYRVSRYSGGKKKRPMDFTKHAAFRFPSHCCYTSFEECIIMSSSP